MAVYSWDASNVDENVLLKDKIHFHHLCHLKKNPNNDKKLILDEVPNGVTMLDYTFSNEGKEIVAGTIKASATLQDCPRSSARVLNKNSYKPHIF